MRVFERCALEPAQWAVVMTEHRTPKLSAESQALYHLTTSPPKWADVMGMYSKVDFSQCVEALSCVTVDQELLLIGESFHFRLYPHRTGPRLNKMIHFQVHLQGGYCSLLKAWWLPHTTY